MYRKVPVRFGPEVAGKGPAPRAPCRRPTGVQGGDPVAGGEASGPVRPRSWSSGRFTGCCRRWPGCCAGGGDARGDGGQRSVYRAGVSRLTELDYTEVIVVNPAHVKALKGQYRRAGLR